MQTQNYNYCQALPIWYDGCYFHSRQELKYALSIEQEYHYIREPVYIPYDPHTKRLPACRWSNVHFYVPDFLIRHKQTRKAFLIEIKPNDFADDKSLILRKKLARQFIRRKNFDWQFKLLNEDGICLTEKQFLKYQQVCNRQNIQLNYTRSYYTIVPVSHKLGLSNRGYVSYVMTGSPPG